MEGDTHSNFTNIKIKDIYSYVFRKISFKLRDTRSNVFHNFRGQETYTAKYLGDKKT